MLVRPRLLPALLATLALLASACGGATPDGTSPTAATGTGEYDGAWVLTDGEHDGQPIPLVEGSPITLDLVGDRASGTGACNGYSGSVQFTDGFFRLGPMVRTEMGCAPEIMASEAAFHRALEGITDAERDGETLRLTGPSTSLVFALGQATEAS